MGNETDSLVVLRTFPSGIGFRLEGAKTRILLLFYNQIQK